MANGRLKTTPVPRPMPAMTGPDVFNMRCSLHPSYEAKRRPRASGENCICREMWEVKQELDVQIAARRNSTFAGMDPHGGF